MEADIDCGIELVRNRGAGSCKSRRGWVVNRCGPTEQFTNLNDCAHSRPNKSGDLRLMLNCHVDDRTILVDILHGLVHFPRVFRFSFHTLCHRINDLFRLFCSGLIPLELFHLFRSDSFFEQLNSTLPDLCRA